MPNTSLKPQKIFADHKGFLGLDEGLDRLRDRFLGASFTFTPRAQREYLELMITAPGLLDTISSITLGDQASRLLNSEAELFAQMVVKAGFLLGIRADLGYERSSLFNRQVVTRGLTGLEERLKQYALWRTTYVVWRNKYYIASNTPTQTIIELNNQETLEFVVLALRHKLIPVVQVKISTNSSQNIMTSKEVASIIYEDLFARMEVLGVDPSDIILQTNFVTPGRHSLTSPSPTVIAQETLKLFQKVLPHNLGGIAFLSDGIRPGFARLYLEEFYKATEKSMFVTPVTFSFGRGLHDGAMNTWGGKVERQQDAQVSLLQNSRLDWISNQ